MVEHPRGELPAPLGRHASKLKELRRRVRSRPRGEVIVDGRRLVSDLVRWRVPVLELYLPASLSGSCEMRRLAEAALACWVVDDAVLAELAPTRHPQGVLAVVAEPASTVWSHQGIALYLDGVQEPGNVGAVIRSAAALGAGGVLLSPGCADPFHWAAVRASAGAVLRLPIERGVELDPAASLLRSRGGEVWAAATEGVPVERWSPRSPLLLLLGAEGRGLSDAAVALADGSVTVPLERGIESLNVGVAAALLLYAFQHGTAT